MLAPPLLLALATSPAARANGQSTHVWISHHALEHLPEGELKELLTDPTRQQMLDNGTMFPDGGYPLGDDYAEIAHWEPFQNRYRDWIAARCPAPWTDECEEHVAFLLGMASHGIADQTYDALYYERGKQHDHDSDFGAHSFDQATDVVFMALVGRVDYPEDWVPYETMVALYAEHGHTVDEDTLATGQNLLRIAILWVGNASEDEALTATESAYFPWMTSHLDDPTVAGNPPCEGEVLAQYWQSVYRRLQGDLAFTPELIATFPEGGYDLETDSDLVESRISLVFSQAIDQASLAEGQVQVTDPEGAVVPTTAWLYYGDGSHVLHVAPQQDWAADTAYTVTVGAGIRTLDGQETTGATTLVVSTAPPPADGGEDSGGAPEQPGKGCNTAPGRGALPGLALLVLAQAAASAGGRPKRQGRSSGRRITSAT